MRKWRRFILCFLPVLPVAAKPTDAWPLYREAAARIREGDKLGKSSPAAAGIESLGFPPYPAEWEDRAKAAYEYNAPALEAIHRAAEMDAANWPVEKNGKDVSLTYLNDLRNIANEVADAAAYEHVHGNDVAALNRVRDLLHLTDLLDQPKDELIVQALVAVGIRAVAFDRLQIIATGMRLSPEGKNDPKAASVTEARELIKQLYSSQVDPTARVEELVSNEIALGLREKGQLDGIASAKKTFQRIQMERNLTVMSLAVHLFYFEKLRWPVSLDELQAYLPAAPVDAWGPMGYVLIRGGTPDGKDRPLVYSRCDGDGNNLAYPTREPRYSFYTIPTSAWRKTPTRRDSSGT